MSKLDGGTLGVRVAVSLVHSRVGMPEPKSVDLLVISGGAPVSTLNADQDPIEAVAGFLATVQAKGVDQTTEEWAKGSLRGQIIKKLREVGVEVPDDLEAIPVEARLVSPEEASQMFGKGKRTVFEG